jgi:tRNA(Ile)-lysidine synthase
MRIASLADFFSSTLQQLGPFEPSPHLVVAVSGGADSMALCLLAHHWARAHGGHITALTVNHGLRAEAAAEAQQVAAWLAARGIAHEVLNVMVAPEKNLQNNARAARYAALSNWCWNHHVLHMLLAHHANDQAETVAMRTARGTTEDGGAGMPMLRNHNGVRLLRPLLMVLKTTLEHYLHTQQQAWLHDTSNDNPRFMRTRIRAQLDGSTTDTENWLQLAARESLARHTRDVQLAQDAASCVAVYADRRALINLAMWHDLPSDRASNVLSCVLRTVAHQSLRARKADILRVMNWLQQEQSTSRKRTLHGCLLMLEKNNLAICPEKSLPHLENIAKEPQVIAMQGFERRVVTSPPKALAEAPFWCFNPADILPQPCA